MNIHIYYSHLFYNNLCSYLLLFIYIIFHQSNKPHDWLTADHMGGQ